MGRKRTPGLYKRGETWHIEKQIFRKRLRESTSTSDLAEAEKYLARRTEELWQALGYGVRPKRTFEEAAAKYLIKKQHKASLEKDISMLKFLNKYIGSLSLECIHMGSLQPYITARQKERAKNRTINYGLQVARHLLAASEWLDEHGLTWLHAAPKIKLLPENDKRKLFPLTWEEQEKLLQALPEHLIKMVLFAANTGCRDQEVCQMRWEWEIFLDDDISVFVVPGELVKNREDRLVVLNTVAKQVVDSLRGQHPQYVFTYKDKPVSRIMSSAWKRARKEIGIPQVRVHDLKHTYGRRLRAAGVSFEDRQDLLGHKAGRVTTHYSVAEIENLIAASNRVLFAGKSGKTLQLLRTNPHKGYFGTGGNGV